MDNSLLYAKTVYLMNQSLHTPDPELCAECIGPDLNELWEFCRDHSIAGLVSFALEAVLRVRPDYAEKFKHWKTRKYEIFYNNLMYDEERGAIFSYFDKNNIHYMPLKGILLNQMYPEPGMREMGDNDILIEASKANQVNAFMRERGYKADGENSCHHAGYEKGSIYRFEMHAGFVYTGFGMRRKRALTLNEYYKDIMDRLIPDSPTSCGLHFSPEDFYIFHINHMEKHYSFCGTGLRGLSDTFVLLQHYPNLNWDYINTELTTLNQLTFENRLRSLVVKLFDASGLNFTDYQNSIIGSLTDEEQTMFQHICSSMTYGLKERDFAVKMSLLHQNVDSVCDLSGIEFHFPLRTKLKLCLYWAVFRWDNTKIKCTADGEGPGKVFLVTSSEIIKGVARNTKKFAQLLFHW